MRRRSHLSTRRRSQTRGAWDINARKPSDVKTYTVKRQRGERGFKLLLGGVLLYFAAYLAAIIGVIYVVAHFVIKAW